MTYPARAISLDACCLINLLSAIPSLFTCLTSEPAIRSASDDPKLQFGLALTVSERVANDECLYICAPQTDGEIEPVMVRADLRPHFESASLLSCKLETEAELERFVHLAARLDDGEAECLAIAKERNWVVATDDRLALSVARELEVAVTSTSKLIQAWAAGTGASDARIRDILMSIQQFARYAPIEESADGQWWHKVVRG